jgi:pimeloyl-ACP methyl ester carboxylesterase
MTRLVLLPGLDGTGRLFGSFLEQLPKEIDAQVVCYPNDRPLTFEEHIDFARAQLPNDKPFVLLAESFSGPVGLQLLADPPDNLLGVIFVATFARYPHPFLLDISRWMPQELMLKLFQTTAAIRFFLLSKAASTAVDIFRSALADVQRSALTRRLEILAELPPPPVPARQLPTLYLQAGNDRLVHARALDFFTETFPGLRTERLPGPHITLLANPKAGAEIISDFINGLTPKDRT